MSHSSKFACEFNAVIDNKSVDRSFTEEPEDMTLIGENHSVSDDLYGFDWLDTIDGDINAPESRDFYHIYIEGHYWFEYTNNSNGADYDLEVEIDCIRYLES